MSGIGDLPPHVQPLSSTLLDGVRDGDRREKRARIGVRRVREDGLRRTHLDDLA